MSEKDLLDEWKQYFEKLLNGENIEKELDERPSPAKSDLKINTDAFTTEEFNKAIDSLSNGKAQGFDAQIESGAVSERLLRTNGNDPHWQWTTNKIVPIPNKGDLTHMTNYRGISFMSTGAKVFNKMLLNRIL